MADEGLVVDTDTPLPPLATPKLVRLKYRYMGYAAETDWMDSRDALSTVRDTVQEMRAILGKACRYERVDEPEWLAEAVAQGLKVNV